MKGFGDRVRWVIGREQWTPWAVRHGFAPSTVDGWLKGEITPYRKTLEKLEEKTGIPAEWWRSGEGPPPLESAYQCGASAEQQRGVEASEPPATYVISAPDKLLVRLAGLAWRLDWISSELTPRDREALALSASCAVLAVAGRDPEVLAALVESEPVLEAALRLCWHASQAATRPAS